MSSNVPREKRRAAAWWIDEDAGSSESPHLICVSSRSRDGLKKKRTCDLFIPPPDVLGSTRQQSATEICRKRVRNCQALEAILRDGAYDSETHGAG